MTTSASAFLFDPSEIRLFVPVGLGIVVKRDSIEPRTSGGTLSNDRIRHANDGGRIDPAAQLCENWAVGTEPVVHGFREDCAKVLFVVACPCDSEFSYRDRSPNIVLTVCFPWTQQHKRRWGYGLNPPNRESG